ncbi:MAG: DegV family protein [Christensenellaceae bacterium]|nr:DegV family protein [Christensenellaceae bacterium]
MGDYRIVTDSSCDLPHELAEELGLLVLPLSVTMGDQAYANHLDGREIGFSEFYRRLRAGEMAKTSAVNVEAFAQLFEPLLEQGRDVLCLGFSSGLSATCQHAQMAAEALRGRFPERKLYVVDTLAASMGQGLLVYLAVMKQREGASIDEVRDYVEGIKLNLCHWFTVDDLHFLKRGGRISTATEIVGSILSIKPVMHVDDEGHLVKVEAVRGRKASIRRMTEKMEETAIEREGAVVFISHGDCLEEAEQLADMVRETMNPKAVYVSYVGPVIGAHSGPGTMALFFLGRKR